MRPKISIIGSGRVGSSVALHVGMKSLGDVILVDIVKGLPQGEALDLNHMAAILGLDVEFVGTNDYRDIEGSEVVVVTAGFIRKADMTRMDLLSKNSSIIREVSHKIREHSPKSKVIIVTNPLDVMTYVALKYTGFERRRVMGFSGLLDLGRYKTLIAKELTVSWNSIEAPILGEHGDSMVLLPKKTLVGGRRITELIGREKVEEIVRETKGMGAKVIALKGWSASHAPGAGAAVMVDSIVRDKNLVVPLSYYLQGEYGLSGVCTVVPAVLGADGVKRVIEIELDPDERAELMNSAEKVRQAQEEVERLLVE
ncbi:MAG: malate dehydrogenase [Thaumarchaeota archaeon]|nr:malate dehydrogenase [Candidatus Calditenuaceae archaeon]MDW8186540.1 malate dehydrogenase [Nitrososphaerota archaeon]